MKPIDFPESNKVWAEDQPPYLPLPAYTDDEVTVSCWRLSWKERIVSLFTGRFWLRQLNFGKALQPQSVSVFSPFVGESDEGQAND
jgi:hypothetical protein